MVDEVGVVELDTHRQLRGQEQQLAERVGILRTRNEGVVDRATIGVGVLTRTVVAAATDTLERGVEVQLMAIILREEVETQTSAVDSVAGLLGDLGLVGRHVELVATTTELTNVVILGSQFRVCRGLIIGAEADCFGVDRGDLRETVIVAVVCVAVADHTEDICSCAVVVRYECGVERGRDIGQSALHYARGIRQREQVALRLLGDDIHHTRDGIRAEESRTSTTHNLDTFDHTCGQLLQTINACQRREDRAAIQQNLSILTLQTIDSQLRKTAVRAAILDTHTGLIIERLGDICRRGAVEQLRGNDIDNRRSLLTIRLLAVG